MSQDKQNEMKASTGSNDTSVGLSGSASAKEEGTAEKPRLAVDSAAEIPNWEKIGWKRVSESEVNPDIKISQYEETLKELCNNDLWLNSGVVFVSLFMTWFITICGGGLGWILILCAFIATFLDNSVKRFYRNAKSDISRNIAKEKLDDDVEKVAWLNEFLRRFWLIYEPVLSASIIQVADNILSASTPGFLDSLKLTNFTLGTKPAMIESIKSYPKTADDELVMDWRISFVPNDLSDMTKAQLVKKINPKVVLTVRVGRGIVGTGIPVLLEDMTFTGLLRVTLKLIPNFPHVKTIGISFLEEPNISYALKPIGGETLGFDIGKIIPGLTTFIKDQVHAALRPMMYAPNSFTLETEYLLHGFPIESSIGVLKLTIKNANNLRNAETFGTSDPYCRVLLQSLSDIKAVGKELTRTKHINNSLNPVWNETRYLLLNNLSDTLKFQIYDSNGSLSTDTLLGGTTFPLQSLVTNSRQPNSTLPIMHNGKQKGELIFDSIWYPVKDIKDDEPAPESNVGILKFNIHQAKDLDPRLSMVGVYNPYIQLKFNEKVVFKSRTFRRSNNPTWEEFFEIFITDRKGAKLELDVRDERDFAEDPIIGSWKMSVDEFLRVNGESKIDWFDIKKAQNDRRGKIRLSCQWKPVILDHNPESSEYVEPIGIVKLHIKQATDLKNTEQLRGKSDPYISIILSSTYRGRTNVQNNNLNPIWDEYFYIPIHSLKEKLYLKCFDHEKFGKDRTLGFTEIEIKDLIKISDDRKLIPAEPIDISAPLTDARGSLSYSASFHPVINKEGEIKEENKENNIDLLNYQSGILVIYIDQANYKKKGTHINVLLDNDRFPVYSTIVSKEPNWNENADIFIKNLDSSKITLDIKTSPSESIGKVEFSVKELLEKDDKKFKLPIRGMSNFALHIGLNYIPVRYVEQDEFSNNMKHSHSENNEIHTANAITDKVNKFGSHLDLLKKNDRTSKEDMTGEIKTSDKPKDDKDVPKSEEIKPNNNEQVVVNEEPIPTNPQEKFAENRMKEPQEEKQTQSEEVKPYDTAFKNDNNKHIGGNNESTRRNVGFEEQQLSKSEGSRSSEENGHHLVANNNKSNRISTYSIHPSEEIIGEPGTLTIYIIEAKNLVPSRGGTKSDSYVKVKMNGKKEVLKTSVIKKSTSPKWDEFKTLTVTGHPVSFLFCVRNRNLLSKDENLGEYELHLWDVIKFNEYVKDFWIPLSRETTPQLHIKLSFNPTSTQSNGYEQVNATNGSDGLTSGRNSIYLGKHHDKEGITSKFSIKKKK